MANVPIRIIMLKEILRLKLQGVSNSGISKSLSLSRTTIVKYVRLLEESKFSLQELNGLSDADLHDLFSVPSLPDKDRKPAGGYEVLLSKFPDYERELQKTGVTRHLLWEQYRIDHPSGLSYSQFCYHFQQWRNHRKVYMHIEYKLGDKMLVDYAGKHLAYVDRETGEIIQTEVFVAILGASQMTYVEASASQKSGDFLRSVENALWFFGGVPRAIVPDNLKSAVNRSSKYEPALNERFADFGRWYNTTILPARSRKPKDKAVVEGAVKIVYHRIYARLHDCIFHSIAELNTAISEFLPAYNTQIFQGRDYSRQTLFTENEKPALMPLATGRYPMRSYYLAKGQKNSHVLLSPDKHYYSIPYQYVGQQLKIVYDTDSVEIYTGTHHRIAVHKRDTRAHGYTTIHKHLPSAHQFVLEWSPEKFISWAEKIGTQTTEVIKTILGSQAHPEQSYKSCIGVLSFAKKVGNQRLEAACQRAVHYGACNYGVIRRILENAQDTLPVEPPAENHIPSHENQRGSNYYQ